MAKWIKNPVEIVITRTDEGIEVALHYGLGCDDDLEMRRGFLPELSPGETAIINQIVNKVRDKIEAHEGV